MLRPIARAAATCLPQAIWRWCAPALSPTCQWFFLRHQQESPPPLVQHETMWQPRQGAPVLREEEDGLAVVDRAIRITSDRNRSTEVLIFPDSEREVPMAALPDRLNQNSWPELPLAAWQDTYATLHMWTQIVGKVRLALSPPMNHWWDVAALRHCARAHNLCHAVSRPALRNST